MDYVTLHQITAVKAGNNTLSAQKIEELQKEYYIIKRQRMDLSMWVKERGLKDRIIQQISQNGSTSVNARVRDFKKVAGFRSVYDYAVDLIEHNFTPMTLRSDKFIPKASKRADLVFTLDYQAVTKALIITKCKPIKS